MNRKGYDSNCIKASQEVVSIYFKNNSNMDDSASDFQEPKKCIAIANNKSKQSINKPKRKTTKKVKGQKDIRTILNMKNDLVNYSKDFDSVCKQTGIDVDSEQLQLAIAMSESLQTSSNEPKDVPENPAPLSSHGRAERIKNNLLKFGFKIPDVNINLGKNRKQKKIRKNSKLLTITDAERRQIIVDKYTSIVMSSLNSYTSENSYLNRLSRIYNLATNSSYEELKCLETFYTNLIEPSPNSIGSLLKDWSKIPGRPPSPIKEVSEINITDLDLNEEELDSIMSKDISLSQVIVKSKLVHINSEESCSSHHSDKAFDDRTDEENCLSDEIILKNVRSPSPDLFDDETTGDESKIIISSNESNEIKPDNSVLSIEKPNVFIDLVNKDGPANISLANLNENSQETVNVIDNIDLTQNYSERKAVNEFRNHDNISIDLTQSSVSSNNESLPEVQISGQNKQKIHLINNTSQELEHDIQKFKDNVKQTNDLDEFVFEHSHESDDKVNSNEKEKSKELELQGDIDLTQKSKSANEELLYANTSQEYSQKRCSSEIDLTQNSSENNCAQTDYFELGIDNEISIDYDDLDDINDENVKNNETNLNLNTSDVEFDNLIRSQNTQESTASQNDVFEISDEELNYSIRKSTYFDTTQSKENYPKNVGLERTEFVDQEVNKTNDDSLPAVEIQGRKVKLRNSTTKTINSDTVNIVHTPNNSEYVMKTQGVTPMQDYESMTTPERNKELGKFGLKPFRRKRAIQLLTHLYNQTHPVVDNSPEDLPSPSKRRKSQDSRSPIKSPILSLKSAARATDSPQKSSSTQLSFGSFGKLPAKSQNSMAKLQKSPGKTQKSPLKSQKQSVKSQKSPGKSQKQSGKTQRAQVEEDVFVNYEVTRECPLIADIYCAEEDWVFQKREKAKLHSCRVPLHIAFHNYVSCRQGLRESILRYEPINIDIVHKELASDGHRYDPKDLLKYLDKKCVTVKTSSNDSRNRNNHVKL